jgi:hypothetical protein
MPPKKNAITVQKRLIQKRNYPLPEESEPVVEEQPPKSVMIVERPRESMIGQEFPVTVPQSDVQIDLVRIGVDRIGGSLFHCILRSTYVPYVDWPREKCIRKVKEFRQDLAINFDGYYLRLDQRSEKWPQLQVCKRDLEYSDGLIRFDYLDYIGKIINKSIVLLTVDHAGVLRQLPGSRIYAKQSNLSNSGNTKTSSPISYHKAEPTFIFIVHLGGPAYELVGLKKNGTLFTLFPESHFVTKSILGD